MPHSSTFVTSLAALLTVVSSSFLHAGEPVAVAHRGLLKHAPENTLAAFDSCLALRLGFEFDVQRTRDGELVCVHDDTLDRTTNGHGPVAASTWQELAALDAGSWFSPRYVGEEIPRISTILDHIRDLGDADGVYAVDLKETDPAVASQVVRMAAERDILDRLLFIGATIRSRELRLAIHNASPKARTAAVVEQPDDLTAALADDSADWMYLRFVPTTGQVTRCHDQNRPVFVAGPAFAGQETDNWEAAITAGVDAILTDYPLELAKVSGGK